MKPIEADQHLYGIVNYEAYEKALKFEQLHGGLSRGQKVAFHWHEKEEPCDPRCTVSQKVSS